MEITVMEPQPHKAPTVPATQHEGADSSLAALKDFMVAAVNDIRTLIAEERAQREKNREEIIALVQEVEKHHERIDATLQKHHVELRVLTQRHARIVLRSAAKRIEELIIEDALNIPQSVMQEYKLYTVDRIFHKLHQYDNGNRKKRLPDTLASIIRRQLDDIQARIAYIETVQPEAASGIMIANAFSDSNDIEDPADNTEDWVSLPQYVDLVAERPEDRRDLRAMLRMYVDLRKKSRRAIERPVPLETPDLDEPMPAAKRSRRDSCLL